MRHFTRLKVLGLTVALAVGIAGCSSAPTGSVPESQSSQNPSDSATSTDAVTYLDVVAEGQVPGGLRAYGFADDLDCDTLGALIPELSGDLFVQEDFENLEDRVVCSWTDVSLEDAKLSDVDLGVTLALQFNEVWNPKYLLDHCAERVERGRTTDLGMVVFDGTYECAGGEINGDRSTPSGDGVWAAMPFFTLSVGVTCEMRTTCRPERINEFSDEESLNALRTIADHLADQLRFVEQ